MTKITQDTIYQLLNIKEGYELPQALMTRLNNNDTTLFDSFLKIEQDLTYDWFKRYFEDNHSERKILKQDFTPEGICELVSELTNKQEKTVADICSGTGGLIIKHWSIKQDKDCFYYAEEYSTTALPFLLFNLAIRNIQAIIFNGNFLTRETLAIYELTKGHKYSRLRQLRELPNLPQFDTVLLNPPYSQPWIPFNDDRFNQYGLAPKSKSDYAFILHGLSLLHTKGSLIAIVPQGILFRGQQEELIRTNLLKDNLIDTVIGLANKLFKSTQIPVSLLILKHRQQSDTLFINATELFKKDKRQNILDRPHIEEILSLYYQRSCISKLSHLATLKEIEENDFNLNLPRYVDTFVEEELPPLKDTLLEIQKIDEEINSLTQSLYQQALELDTTIPETKEELALLLEILKS